MIGFLVGAVLGAVAVLLVLKYHPANLKLAAVKAEVAKLEVEGQAKAEAVKAEFVAVVARLKALL